VYPDPINATIETQELRPLEKGAGIDCEAEQLAKVISSLNDRVAVLSERLGPVLRQEGPVTVGLAGQVGFTNSTAPTQPSPLANRLGSLIEQALGIEGRLGRLVALIDL
jgi:hypothetical protein